VAGFCPAGPNCPDAHPRFELPGPVETDSKGNKKVTLTCHFCSEFGHKFSACPNIPEDMKEQGIKGKTFSLGFLLKKL